MNQDWKEFLLKQSAEIEDGPDVDAEAFITDLSRFSVLEISGEDAESFLQAQLSSDVSSLKPGNWQRSAWCNIKGRVIATFLIYRSDSHFLLLVEHEQCESISKRLQMFVLRAKVSITDQSGILVRLGLSASGQILDEVGGDKLVVMPLEGNPQRAIVICPAEAAIALWQSMSSVLPHASPDAWALKDIRAGLPWVGVEGSEEFLPQSLNLDLLGGLSFDKGCYPGQEIVARMHFRGKLKQRLFVARVSSSKDISSGDKIYSSSAQQHVGQIVNRCKNRAGQYEILIALDLAAVDENTLHLLEENGPELELLELPYSLDS